MLVSGKRYGRDELWHTGKCVLQLKEKATSRFQPITATWKQAQCCQISQFLLRELESHVSCQISF